MKEVFSAATGFEARLIRNLLLEHGIEAVVINEELQASYGTAQLDGMAPAVCILDDTRFEEAQAILAERRPLGDDDSAP